MHRLGPATLEEEQTVTCSPFESLAPSLPSRSALLEQLELSTATGGGEGREGGRE